MGALPLDLANAYRCHWTDGKAGAAAGAGLFVKLGQEGPAGTRTEADRLRRTGVATGLAIGAIPGKTALADHRDVWKLLWPAGEDRLGTEFRALAAEGALGEGEIERRAILDQPDNLRRTGVDAPSAAGAGLEAFRGCSWRRDTPPPPLITTAEKISPR